MRLGMTPGWYDAMPRFEFSPHIRVNGITHTLASLRIVPPGPGSLRIHVTMARGVEAIATHVIRRLVIPYEAYFTEIAVRCHDAGRAVPTRKPPDENSDRRDARSGACVVAD
jgi:hypothetical protein